MENLVKVSSRKFLVRDLKRNIELDNNKCFEFNSHRFYRDGDSDYKILDENGNDIGTFNIVEITESFLKFRIRKQTQSTKNSPGIKSAPRKKKRYDIISNEFMGFVKEQKCMVDGCNSNNSEAHHIYGRQPARHDILCVPLCPEHHRGSLFSVHEGNVKDFREKYPREKMEKISLSIFKSWIESGNGDEYMKDLLDTLSKTTKKMPLAIKDFIVGQGRKNKKKSNLGD